MGKFDQPSRSWLYFDNTKVVRSISKDVELPLSKKDELIMHKLMEFVKFSQDPKRNTNMQLVVPAVGLAAPQIGSNTNMYYIRIEEKDDDDKVVNVIEHAMINPKITGKSDIKAALSNGEGCLSVPKNQEGYVPRSYKIIVEGYDYLKKQNVSLIARGYEAIVFQHEQDHLNGILYYDYINKEEPWQKSENLIIV